MPRPRSEEQWSRLKPSYRNRLIRRGITKEQYLAGANLQYARSQQIEARRTAERRNFPSLPAPSTVRAWRARARARGVTPEDWQKAVNAAGPDNFDDVKDMVRGKEAAHRAWMRDAATQQARRLAAERNALFDYHDYMDDAPVEWGESWGFYH